MKKILLLSLACILISCLKEPKKSNDEEVNTIRNLQNDKLIEKPIAEKGKENSKTLNFLKALNGKYPNDVKIFDDKKFKDRLKSVLSSRYTYLMETWGPETPIEITGDFFISEACQKHNCYDTNFIIIYDFDNDVLEIGIKEGMKISVYSDGINKSYILMDWEQDE